MFRFDRNPSSSQLQLLNQVHIGLMMAPEEPKHVAYDF
jgi:hypothetical protein